MVAGIPGRPTPRGRRKGRNRRRLARCIRSDLRCLARRHRFVALGMGAAGYRRSSTSIWSGGPGRPIGLPIARS